MIIFKNDEEYYLRWVDENGDRGFVVNSENKPSPNNLVLHDAACGHIRRYEKPQNYTTPNYFKICSRDVDELREWATKEVGGELRLCKDCVTQREKAGLSSLD
jgi:hypothetical protein